MKKFLLCAAVMLAVVACNEEHGDTNCDMDALVRLKYIDVPDSHPDYKVYSFYFLTANIYDRMTGEKLLLHSHMRGYGNGNLSGFFVSPEICNRTFPSTRLVALAYFKDKRDQRSYVMTDTIDSELHYLDFDKCYIESISLNGVKQWDRNDPPDGPIPPIGTPCYIQVDPARFVEGKPEF